MSDENVTSSHDRYNNDGEYYNDVHSSDTDDQINNDNDETEQDDQDLQNQEKLENLNNEYQVDEEDDGTAAAAAAMTLMYSHQNNQSILNHQLEDTAFNSNSLKDKKIKTFDGGESINPKNCSQEVMSSAYANHPRFRHRQKHIQQQQQHEGLADQNRYQSAGVDDNKNFIDNYDNEIENDRQCFAGKDDNEDKTDNEIENDRQCFADKDDNEDKTKLNRTVIDIATSTQKMRQQGQKRQKVDRDEKGSSSNVFIMENSQHEESLEQMTSNSQGREAELATSSAGVVANNSYSNDAKAARSERKRNREKLRRSNVNKKFDDLIAILMEIENSTAANLEKVAADAAAKNNHYSVVEKTHSSALATSNEDTADGSGSSAATSHVFTAAAAASVNIPQPQPPANRVDLINRAVHTLTRLHFQNREWKQRCELLEQKVDKLIHAAQTTDQAHLLQVESTLASSNSRAFNGLGRVGSCVGIGGTGNVSNSVGGMNDVGERRVDQSANGVNGVGERRGDQLVVMMVPMMSPHYSNPYPGSLTSASHRHHLHPTLQSSSCVLNNGRSFGGGSGNNGALSVDLGRVGSLYNDAFIGAGGEGLSSMSGVTPRLSAAMTAAVAAAGTMNAGARHLSPSVPPMNLYASAGATGMMGRNLRSETIRGGILDAVGAAQGHLGHLDIPTGNGVDYSYLNEENFSSRGASTSTTIPIPPMQGFSSASNSQFSRSKGDVSSKQQNQQHEQIRAGSLSPQQRLALRSRTNQSGSPVIGHNRTSKSIMTPPSPTKS